jgi:hypothetical protein
MTDPIDDTQPHPSVNPGPAADGAGATDATTPREIGSTPPASGASEPRTDSEPPLQADPDRPADSGWREPPWFPPRDRGGRRDRRPSAFAMVIGLILIAIGAYYFLDRTLGIALPRIQWGSVWPVILIVIGGLILVRSFQRKS